MNSSVSKASRRLFLQQASALSVLGPASPLALCLSGASAMAETQASDYKALVCIFLYGGNDAFNTVLPTDAPSWANYTAVRNQQPESIALLRNVAADKSSARGSPAWLGGVLPLPAAASQGGRSFALHPAMADAQGLFNNARKLAIVANVGPLAEPISKADYLQGLKQKPRKLFSHNDQQSTWMAMAPEGATIGWGGRMADAMASSNGNSLFSAISTNGQTVWASGQSTKIYQVSPTGPIRLGTEPDAQGVARAYGSANIGAALESIVTRSRGGHLMAQDLADLGARSIRAERALSAALPTAGPSTPLMYETIGGGMMLNPLAQQLQTVARMVATQAALGMKRQVFFVGLSGFDTHNNQNRTHAEMLSRLSHGLKFFDTTLASMGMSDQVTTFTASDFGRSFTSNGDGTDHGWGGHHMVMGGAVRGGDIYGSFPQLAKKNAYNNDFDDSPDQLTNGVLLPGVSIDQYAATMGRWFGLSGTQLNDVFPNLKRFNTRTDLGFMQPT